MSRVSNSVLDLGNISVHETETQLEVKGAGSVSLTINKVKDVRYIFEGKNARVEGPAALAGTAIRLLEAAVEGARKPFERIMEVHGAGTKVVIDRSANCIVMEVGYSHSVRVPIPRDIEVMPKEGGTNAIVIKSRDKRALGDFGATIKKVRKNNAYGHFYIIFEGEKPVFKKRGLNG